MKSQFSEMVKTRRICIGLTQAEVSSKLGYGNSQFISNVERGLCLYPIKQFKKLSRILDMRLESLFLMYMREIELRARKELGLKK